MITTLEQATQKSTTLARLSVHHTSFLWALCQEPVRSTIHLLVAQRGAGLPLPEIYHPNPICASRCRMGTES